MMIIRGDKVSLSFGTHILLDQASFSLNAGEKVAIVGRNGAGKSSLLKLVAQVNEPDSGVIQRQKSARVRYLAQALPEPTNETIFEYVSRGVSDIKEALERYQSLLETGGSESEINDLHDLLDRCDGWHWQQKVEQVLSRLELDGSLLLNTLSGGWRRRVSLAECLAAEPDLLLLDEPTNHLDLETIEWLETSLKMYRGAMLLISHDRQFIDAVVDQIWEIDRGHLSMFPAPYQAYVESKEKKLAEEEKVNSEFDKKLAQEEKWIRQGIKARRTRNEGRVRALKAMRMKHADRRTRQSTAQLDIKSGSKSGKLVAVIENVTLTRGDKTLFHDFSTTILKGDKIGILGANGCGKSSLIKMILGELKADTGLVELGTQLDIAYFDQMRSLINPELTIFDNVGEGRDFLEVNGERRHVISYLADYGFGPERMKTPASSLSGGEVSRLVLAKLFTHSANLLILDEPTNDLDIETLELLESQLVNFAGTVIVISHDRRFLDNVAAALLVFDQTDGIVEIEGGFQDYDRYRKAKATQLAAARKEVSSGNTATASSHGQASNKSAAKPQSAKSKLSYKYQRELDALPAELEELETQIESLEQETQTEKFLTSSPDDMQVVFQQLADLQGKLEEKMDRWEELESMKEGN
ncbi:ATP-binding cassette domain-containing protein [Pleionea sediminis]|uniref:ATP-binding cassette domain-containing protein n=1 Tax=Pleionea sediminis TaxID=2569479 RepID=UPI001185BEE0|nr:ATP-binding cassette domain-containing protein [Pleionea sediminis]